MGRGDVSTEGTSGQADRQKKPSLSRRLFGEPAGARTRDPNIKSVVLYQLSYGFNTCQTVETVFFRFGGANVENIFVLPK